MEKLGLTISNLNSKCFKKLQRKHLTNQIISDLYGLKKSNAQLKKWVKDLCPQISEDIDAHEKHFFECVQEINIRLGRLQKSKPSRSSFYRIRNRVFDFPTKAMESSSENSIPEIKGNSTLKGMSNDIDLTIDPPSLSQLVIHFLDCPHCPQFRTLFEQDLKHHVVENHPKEARILLIFSCPICRARCTSMNLLQQHKRMYHEKNFQSMKMENDIDNDHNYKPEVYKQPATPPVAANNSKNNNSLPKKNLKRNYSTTTPPVVEPRNKPNKAFSPPFTRRSLHGNSRANSSAEKSAYNTRNERSRTNSASSSTVNANNKNSGEKSNKTSKVTPAIRPDVYKRMKELYAMGTTNPVLLKNFLQIFVERDLIINYPVCKTDQRYFPTLNTIKTALNKNSNDFPPVVSSMPKSPSSVNSMMKTLSNRRGVVNIGSVPKTLTNRMSASYHNSKRGLTKIQAKRMKYKGLSNKATPTPVITNVRSELSTVDKNGLKTFDQLPLISIDVDSINSNSSNGPTVVSVESLGHTKESNSVIAIDRENYSNKKTYDIHVGLDYPRVKVTPILIENIPDTLCDAIVIRSINNEHLLDIDSTSSSSSSLASNNKPCSFPQDFVLSSNYQIVIKNEDLSPSENGSQLSLEKLDFHKQIDQEPVINFDLKTEPDPPNPSDLSDIAGCSNRPSVTSVIVSKPTVPLTYEEEEAVCRLCFGEFADNEELRLHMSEIHPLGF